MSEERANLFRNIRQVHKEGNTNDRRSGRDVTATSELARGQSPQPTIRKRGRPATGKRSDPEWIGRTYYVKRSIDLDVEGILVQLKRRGIDLDKSELVNSLLMAWVAWQQDPDSAFPTHEVLPQQSSVAGDSEVTEEI